MNSNSDMIKKAYNFLYKEKCPYDCVLKFSSRFHDYGATIALKHRSLIEFRASRKWFNNPKNNSIEVMDAEATSVKGESICENEIDKGGIDEDIFIGFIQHLLLKLFGNKKGVVIDEYYLNLYESFIHNIDRNATIFDFNGNKKDLKNDPLLVESFKRVNNKYFFDFIDMPHLVFGREGKTQMGRYDFRTNKIVINSIFKKPLYLQHFHRNIAKITKLNEITSTNVINLTNRDENNSIDSINKDTINSKLIFAGKYDMELIVDLIMYHEMLHKKLKFKTNNISGKAGSSGMKRRIRYHTTEFRRMEKKFENWKEVEKQLQGFMKFTRKFKFKLLLKNPSSKDFQQKPSSIIKSKNFNIQENIKRIIFGIRK